MTKGIHNADNILIGQSLRLMGVHMKQKPEGAYSIAMSCCYFPNPDGSVRWLWPAGATEPQFLQFYYSGHWRSAIFTTIIRLIFWLGIQKIIFRPRILGYTTANAFVADTNWALFTGTAGPNRKAVIYWHNSEGHPVFTKIAMSGQAARNLGREYCALKTADTLARHGIQTPAALRRVGHRIDLGLLGADGARHTPRLALLPEAPLQYWLQQNLHRRKLQETACWYEVKSRIDFIAMAQDKRLPYGLAEKLRLLVEHLDRQNPEIPLTQAHGDFTPWNVRHTDSDILVWDWELSHSAMPALYDLFHYVYQSNILIGRKPYESIRHELNEIQSQSNWVRYFNRQLLAPALMEQYYLACTLSYYLALYIRQEQWHTQVEWLLNAWSEALSYVLTQEKEIIDPRRLLLLDLSDELRKHRHAAMKYRLERIEELPETSDLDICVERHSAKALSAWLEKHPLVKGVRKRNFSFMTQVEAILTDNRSLALDLIWRFKRKNLVMLDAAGVLQRAGYTQSGINTAAPVDNFLYIWLFYQLNRANIPLRYRQQFEQLPYYEQTTIRQQINTIMGKTAAAEAFSEAEAAGFAPALKKSLRRLPANNRGNYFWHTLTYWGDILRSLTFEKGFIVTFSGVDGAGKSTVIQNVRLRLEGQLRRRVVVLRHRPSVLPILSAWRYGPQEAEARSVARLPRQGNNKSVLSSALRFAYYFLDYFIGQFYIRLKYLSRGYIVMYDRYFFDFINDSKRSNIQLPERFVSAFYSLLLKPRYNFFLYAPAEDILKRKQELDADTIGRLTRSYLGLFKRLGRKYKGHYYTPIVNLDLEQTTHTILTQIRQHR